MLLCVLLAALPDLDLLYPQIHRTITHSVPVGVLMTIIAVAVTRWVTRQDAVGIGFMCGAAWSSHILLDWLGADFRTPRGIQAFWPFSDAWFIAGVDLFAETERQRPFSVAAVQRNLITAAREIAIMGPIVIALWWGRVRGPLRSHQPGS